MSKAAVYIILTATFVLLTLRALQPNHHGRGPRILNRRMGFKAQPHQLFDPLVTRVAEESGLEGPDLATANWETTPLRNELHLEEMERFLGNEGKLNITLRLIYLYPHLDKAPKDGLVELEELRSWILGQANDRLTLRTEKELVARDKDGDGEVSLRECLHRLSKEDLDKNGMEEGGAGWWKEQFKNADADRNGLLNFNELQDFLFPEDSNNDKIKTWLILEKLKTVDLDHDDKITLEEFDYGIYDIYTSYFEFENGRASVPSSEDLFDKLDVDKDKFVSVEELKLILQYLSPGEISYAEYYTSYLIYEADDDKDGKLSLDEMINHEYIFYNTVYEDEYDDRGEDEKDDDDSMHGEF